jgi:hypothetical protein
MKKNNNNNKLVQISKQNREHKAQMHRYIPNKISKSQKLKKKILILILKNKLLLLNLQ